jgi:hypothetical protein
VTGAEFNRMDRICRMKRGAYTEAFGGFGISGVIRAIIL